MTVVIVKEKKYQLVGLQPSIIQYLAIDRPGKLGMMSLLNDTAHNRLN